MNYECDFAIKELERYIVYIFKNKKLAKEALTHSSLKTPQNHTSNERLEFLGDSVLNLIISEALYIKYQSHVEGMLSRIRSKLVSSTGICKVARTIQLQKLMLLSLGEEKSGGRNNPKNIENTMEAIIGAVYLDGDFEASRIVVLRLWSDWFESDAIEELDSKSKLQQWSQARQLGMPTYSLVNQSGSKHMPLFEVEAIVPTIGSAIGKGGNKKTAEQDAASMFIHKFCLG